MELFDKGDRIIIYYSPIDREHWREIGEELYINLEEQGFAF